MYPDYNILYYTLYILYIYTLFNIVHTIYYIVRAAHSTVEYKRVS